jgi:hypothetical protein
VFDHVVDSRGARPREQFEAVAAAIRQVLSQLWVRTQRDLALTYRRRGTIRWLPRPMGPEPPLRQHHAGDRCARPRSIRCTLSSPFDPMAGME